MKKALLSTLILCISLALGAADRVALVLSGGGARGYAHIAVIEELERRGIYPDFVIGTSMGGLVGGLYASGYSGSELERYILETDVTSAVFDMSVPFSSRITPAYDFYPENIYSIGDQNSILNDDRLNTLIHSAICRNESFKDLSIPFYAISMDFFSGESVVLSKGSLFDALRGTISLPVGFPPYALSDGRYLSDGGMVSNLAAKKARELGADIVIAVDVNESTRLDFDTESLKGTITQFIILNTQLNANREYEYADYVLIPELSDFTVLDFGKEREILDAGKRFVRENQKLFDEIESRVGNRGSRPEAYLEKGYRRIDRIELPADLQSYYPLFRRFVGHEYTEELTIEIGEVLSSIKSWEGLSQIAYSFLDGVISVHSVPGRPGERKLSFGISDGPTLSLSGSCHYLVGGLSAGQNLKGMLGIRVPFFRDFSMEYSAWGGVGGFSAISTWYLYDRIPTEDLAAGAAFRYGGRVFRDIVLYTGAAVEYYDLGRERNVGSSTRLWDDEEFYVPYAFINGRILETNTLERYGLSFRASGEYRLGYRKRAMYLVRGDVGLRFRIGSRSSLDLSGVLFFSRFPFELSSSYFSDDFGILNKDYISARLLYEHTFPSMHGLCFSLGPFINIGEEHRSFDIAGSEDEMALFKYLEEVRYGLYTELGFRKSFGYYGLSMAISQKGDLSLRLRFR